jgi:hypothetical protein
LDDVEAVQLSEHVENEIGSALLAIGQEIEPQSLLLMQSSDGGIIEGFPQQSAFHAERHLAAVVISKPCGTG